MSEEINIIFDASGSFGENGKSSIEKMLAVSARRIAANFGAEVIFFIWREEIEQLRKLPDLKPEGRAEIDALTNFIEDNPDGSKFLLITDSFKSLSEVAKIKKILEEKNSDLILMTVGADAAREENYNVSTFGGIFSPADFPTALQMLMSGNRGEEI